MNQYFKNKIGQTITKDLTTGERFFTEVYRRRYTFEVISIVRGKLTVWVKSYDICPSEIFKSGTNKDLGEVTIHIKGFSSIDAILKALIANVDKDFVKKYPQAI